MNNIENGREVVDYNKVYEYMCNKYNLIRVSEDGFDTKMNETNLRRIGTYIKKYLAGNKYLTIYISNIDNINDTTAINMETIEEENYDVIKALMKTKQRNRLIGRR